MNKNRHNKRVNIKKVIILISFIALPLILYNKIKSNTYYNLLSFTNQNNSDYKIIKLDNNKNYSGIGQEKVKGKDGYFTTFTTDNQYKKTYKEYKQNGNASWSNKDYWGGSMSENGCGITTMSIILSGYNKNYTPEDLRIRYSPVIDYSKLSKELSSTFGIKNSDFYYDNVHLSNKKIQEHLRTNRPIIICTWTKPKSNRWTASSHYMALLASDENDLVYISNPNGGENDYRSSGWYNINEITPYIAKALYIESFE